MSSITSINNFLSNYPAPGSKAPAAARSTDSIDAADQPDTVDISNAGMRQDSLTGRIALNLKAGNLTSDQANQLYQQVSSIHSQIEADQQANGGTLSPTDAQAISQLQNSLSATIYSDAHNGAAPPTNPSVSTAVQREALEAGRIVLNEKAGNLSSSQAQSLFAEQAKIDQQIAADQQANSGSLTPADAQAINQAQNQASQHIHDLSHGNTLAS